MNKGVCFVAYGAPAMLEAAESYQSLRKVSDLPVAMIADKRPPYHGIEHIPYSDTSFGARWAKLNLDQLTPYDQTLYLDADTRIMDAAVVAGFAMLDDGYDMVFVPSTRQHGDVMGHIDAAEREFTLLRLGHAEPLGLQAGVMWFASNKRTAALFQAWREEWQLYKRHDQAALLRALERVPVKIWLLSFAFNSRRGQVVEHWFGRARINA